MKYYNLLVMGMFMIMAGINANAGILGKRYIGISIGQVTPGDEDLKEIDDSIFGYGVGIRLPIDANLDFLASIGQSKLEGNGTEWDPYYGIWYDWNVEATGTSLYSALQYQLQPGQQVNPFIVGGILRVKSEGEVKVNGYSESEDDDDTGFEVGGGIEFNIDDKTSFNIGVNYQSEIFDEDDTSMGIGFNIWASPQTLLSIVGGYNFDSEDKSILAGISVKFGENAKFRKEEKQSKVSPF